jgi:hypothetical protein
MEYQIEWNRGVPAERHGVKTINGSLHHDLRGVKGHPLVNSGD